MPYGVPLEASAVGKLVSSLVSLLESVLKSSKAKSTPDALKRLWAPPLPHRFAARERGGAEGGVRVSPIRQAKCGFCLNALKIVWVGRNRGLAPPGPCVDEVKSPLSGMYFPFCAHNECAYAHEAQRKRG